MQSFLSPYVSCCITESSYCYSPCSPDGDGGWGRGSGQQRFWIQEWEGQAQVSLDTKSPQPHQTHRCARTHTHAEI